MPLLQSELRKIRKEMTENNLIKLWLYERKNCSERLKNALSQVEICPISDNLRDLLRARYKIKEEDIDLMNDYTKFSAFNLKDTGLMSNHE